jgi:hypothetical protein
MEHVDDSRNDFYGIWYFTKIVDIFSKIEQNKIILQSTFLPYLPVAEFGIVYDVIEGSNPLLYSICLALDALYFEVGNVGGRKVKG